MVFLPFFAPDSCPSTPRQPRDPADSHEKRDFIRQIVREDLASGKHQAIKTRFPPEPNGYLHIGHAKSICLNFGIAGEFSGVCNLRFDDTNPAKEDPEYVAAIQDDVRWLGFEWNELRHASDYFQAYYLAAEKLIEQGKAYVCDLSAEEVRAYRGTLTEPGRPSPWRDRSVEENLDLFRRMRAGEFPDGARTLRAKIDMASGNINLRDPALYRIKHVEHQNTGNAWPIYPMYDFAHALGDSIEGITHSLCTLEFEDHRPLYDWCVDNVDFAHDDALTQPLVDAGLPREAAKPRQIEFSRLNINYTVCEQAQADGAGHRAAGGRLGRPAHADPAGPASPWLHPGRDAPVRRARGHQQAELADRLQRAGRRVARRPGQCSAAPHGSDRSGQAGADQPAGRP